MDTTAGRPHSLTAQEIALKNQITISGFPCSFGAQEVSVPVAVLDEFGHFRVEGVNVDKEVCDSIRQAMAPFQRPKLIKISSPYGKAGQLCVAVDVDGRAFMRSAKSPNENAKELFRNGSNNPDR